MTPAGEARAYNDDRITSALAALADAKAAAREISRDREAYRPGVGADATRPRQRRVEVAARLQPLGSFLATPAAPPKRRGCSSKPSRSAGSAYGANHPAVRRSAGQPGATRKSSPS